jgi:serine protease AprX
MGMNLRIPGLMMLATVVLLFFGPFPDYLSGQAIEYKYFYRVYFADKGDYSVNDFSASELMSERAVRRRLKFNIPYPDIKDLPVYHPYLEEISSMGFKLHCTSKWMNTGLFKTVDQADINTLKNLSYVSDVKVVKSPVTKSNYHDKLDLIIDQDNPPPYDTPLSMINGYALHYSGFNGSGVLIAVLDGGFYKADVIPSLNHLRVRNGIEGTRDIVAGGDFVYDYHYHGTAVMSVLAGLIPGELEGVAPEANFWIIRTEDVSSEFPVEEDFWAAGAELADSLGADIISSSLGYFVFDDPSMNYKFSDMDGNTTFVTRAADNAASKGILVVASAGNERNDEWLRIIAPSDGDSVISAGGVDAYNNIAVFSSAGPSADGRVKPDNVAQAVGVPVQLDEYSTVRVNGTSFSCPVLSGICACLMQAVPQATNEDIITALHESGDRYNSPDSLYGYGLPDMSLAISKLQDKYVYRPENEIVLGPNPFTSDIEITFREAPGKLTLEIYNTSGKTIISKKYNDYVSRTMTIKDLEYSGSGLYFIRFVTSGGTYTRKVIKINR